MKQLTIAVIGLLLTASAATAADAERTSLQILGDASHAISSYSQFTIFDDVTATVQDGMVTLTGKVTMPYKRGEIEKRVARVDGVKRVTNRIGVLPVSGFDNALRVRIARAIYGNANFWNYAIMPNPPIHIIVEHGRVTLTGVVQSDVDRALARSLATDFDALSVTSELKTAAEARELRERTS